MKKFLLLSFMLMFAFTFSESWAQERTVSGKVTSIEDGSTLPGVNVVLKGTTTGTVTDIDGNYRLSVPSDGGTLVFSFIGLASEEVAVGARSVIDVQMSADVKQLSEVVITGYGSQLKRDLTGSVSSIKAEEIEGLPMQSFDRAIQGRAAGTQISAASGQPGGALNIRIRGVGSINSGNDPLIIIDGVQVASLGGSAQASSNPLNSINPNDIESIDILKDPATAAIYGAQAANGVIVVTTKSGKKGGKTNIDLSYQEGVVQPLNLYDVLDARQYAEIQAEQETNVGLDPSRVNGSFDFFGDPNDPSTYENYDWLDNMFQDARFTTLDFTMSGGDEKTSFYFGGSYNKQEAQIIKSDFERFTGRLNLSHRATDKLTVGAKLAITNIKQFGAIANGNFVNGPFVAAFSAIPSSPAIDTETGEFNPYPTNALSHLYGYNILQGVNQEVRLGRTLQTVSSANISYQIIPGLSVNGLVGIDFSMNRDDNERPRSIPVFAAAGGSVAITNRRSLNWNTNVNLNYSKTFNDVHTVGGIIGYEYKAEQREGNNLTANQFPNAFFRLPGNGQPQAVGGFFQEYKRLGYFGKFDYAYDDRYLGSVTVRRDGHSRFGSENQYGLFYAGSVGWRLSEESFLSGIEIIDDLKLKASYGILGNAEIGNYLTQTTYGASSGQYAGASPLTIGLLGNDEISWEEEESINLGVDFSLFNNRLYGTVDFWRTNNNDLLFQVPFLQTSGINPPAGQANPSVTNNIGSVRNQGIDIEVGGIIFDKGGFRWDSRFNVTFLENEVTKLVDADTIFNGNIPDKIVGQPVSFHYLLDYAGVNPANGRAMIRDANGNLTYNPGFEDGAVRGSALPTSYGGWSNTFSYKGISLDIFFQYQFGNDAFNADYYNLLATGGVNNRTTDILERWQNPGDVTNIARLTNNGNINGIAQNFGFIGTNQFMSDASYIRLKTLTLSYELPQNLLNKVGFRQVRVFAQGVNLVTWTKFDGIDPEVVTNNNSTGVSGFGAYPVGRQYSVGINLGL
ncbi:TonB-dependent receptor [Fulvivirga sp.]|uniref:SusC/RagA family TonB-linked outer membrane protein n=1 Tax=Fulvivirga sp. TaxID=1931237 RepID=UPI0032F00E16